MGMEQYSRVRRSSLLPLIILIIFITSFWWFYLKPKKPVLDPNAKPRVVEARGSLADDERNSIEIFQSASPSVVYITSVELRRNLFTLNIYEIPKGTGSGFVWDREGRIVTNYHVIEDANRIEVTLADNTTWKAILVGTAPDKDMAVLQISAPPKTLKPIPLGDSKNLLVGQKVFAIGNPFGLDRTMTSGIVSALGREIKTETGRTIHGVIQTDAAINPGNSGGPLLDSAGRLIGINTAIYSPSGASAGIGFAVPVEVVNRTVPEIIKYGHTIRPGLAISIASESVTKRLGIKGILIINVQKNSTADAAGLRGTKQRGRDIILGDIILEVNGVPVHNYDELRNEFDKHKIGDTVPLLIARAEKKITPSPSKK